jgi:hypothetical protein
MTARIVASRNRSSFLAAVIKAYFMDLAASTAGSA